MSALNFVPPRVPLIDQRTGWVAREWYAFFQGLYVRAGGSNGLSTTDVDAGSFAAMQPACSDNFFADLVQCGGGQGDTAGEPFCADQPDIPGADLMQIDTTEQIQFWSP